MKAFTEYPGKDPCPCGSKKPYAQCCKKTQGKWGYGQDGRLVRRIPMSSQLEEALQKQKDLFAEYYGREPGEEDFVQNFAPVYQDAILLHTMRIMEQAGLPPEDIYAYYRTDGLLPCQSNEDIMPERDKQEFSRYREEYLQVMSRPIQSHMNILQFTAVGNDTLAAVIETNRERLVHSLNDFIHRHTLEPCGIRRFAMKSERDYLLFSALKTIRTIEGVALLLQELLPECIHSLGRSAFENYMYLNMLNQDEAFFEQTLRPRVDEEKFAYVVKENGKTDYNRMRNKETGEIHQVHVVVARLKNAFVHQQDKDLYDLYYNNACKYIHVDVKSAAGYFSIYNPYEQLDPALVAAATTLGVCVLLYQALADNRWVQPQFQKDARHLARQMAQDLAAAMDLLKEDDRHGSPIYETLKQRLRMLTEDGHERG